MIRRIAGAVALVVAPAACEVVARAPTVGTAPGLSVVEHAVLTLDELPSPNDPTLYANNFDVYARRSRQFTVYSHAAALDGSRDLAQLGLRLEGGDLLQDGKVVVRDVAEPVHVVRSANDADFAVVVRGHGSSAPCTLVRKRSVSRWECSLVNMQAPAFVGADLLAIEATLTADESPEDEQAGRRAVMRVRREGAVVFEHPFVFVTRPLVDQLTTWGDHWAVGGEPFDDVWVDGKTSVRGRGGYDEVFAWQVLRDKPLFLYRKRGHYGVNYGGSDLSVAYDDVFHGRCCELAAFNPNIVGDTLVFHARRDRTWYVVMVTPT